MGREESGCAFVRPDAAKVLSMARNTDQWREQVHPHPAELKNEPMTLLSFAARPASAHHACHQSASLSPPHRLTELNNARNWTVRRSPANMKRSSAWLRTLWTRSALSASALKRISVIGHSGSTSRSTAEHGWTARTRLTHHFTHQVCLDQPWSSRLHRPNQPQFPSRISGLMLSGKSPRAKLHSSPLPAVQADAKRARSRQKVAQEEGGGNA
jgi:hypothetical protein